MEQLMDTYRRGAQLANRPHAWNSKGAPVNDAVELWSTTMASMSDHRGLRVDLDPTVPSAEVPMIQLQHHLWIHIEER